uniref:Integrase catalytic domain-containing protein n=1 Tax=Caenorhabditis brenneri TaxID=135651 RepID=B6VBB9_CAEBE|nr:hypothetical protein Cbre_JD03.001 [Caenorhabditis brenneri]
MFSDASKFHYATTAYLRFEYPNHSFQSRLLFCKSRVKPRKVGITIPQMELMALETATNAAINLQKELHIKISKVFFFSDSTCTLYWVLHKVSSHIGLKWAANRVSAIRHNLTKLAELDLCPELRYVPTKLNPADIATRGCSMAELQQSDLWNNGPAFLQSTEDQWPPSLETAPDDAKQFHGFAVDKYSEDVPNTSQASNTTEEVKQENIYHLELNNYRSIVPYSRTNSMSRLVTIMSYVLRFAHHIIRNRNNRFPENAHRFNSTTLKNYDEADKDQDGLTKRRITRTFIIKDHYADAEERLNLKPPPSFNPILEEDGLYHHKRPFSNSRYKTHTDAMKSPIIIIQKHRLAYLLVIESHLSLLHQGVKDVISDIQRTYWIEHLGSLVKKVRSKCVTCRTMHANPFHYPFSKILPSIRSDIVHPFAYVGLDYFGPIRYQSRDDNNKVWVLLVTCLVTRSIHLEVVPDNTTHSFILALKRYFGRRGVPKSILSDNAPTFKLGYSIMNTDLKTLINNSLTLTSFLEGRQIKIRFITPYSPWKGGIYERLVAIVKNMVFKVLRKITLPFLELESLLIETEGIINSRPITSNKIHLTDAEPIRPVDFLIPKVHLAIPESNKSLLDVITNGETEKLTRRLLESTAAVRDNLWNIFSEEYFIMLRESNIREKRYSKEKPIPGTTVLIVTDRVARYKWPIGVIQKLIESQDGAVRSVLVKVGKKIFEKSINQLIPLELPTEEDAPKDVPTPLATSEEKADDEEVTQSNVPETSEPTVHQQRTRPYLHRKAKDKKVTFGHEDSSDEEDVDFK